MAARGCTIAEIAQTIAVSPSTVYDWRNKHKEFAEALESGRMLGKEAVENSLFRLATGNVWEETEVTERDVGADGKEHVHVRRSKTKKAPNTAAAIFYLKNRAGYRDNPPERPGGGEAPVDPLSAALIERAKGLEHGT